MTLLNKTPQARKEALVYCRRCLAVMLCCVMVFWLTLPAAPRAKAAVTDVAIVGMGGMGGGASWGASTPGGMAFGDPVGACIAQVAMLGSDAISSFVCGYAQGGTNTKYYGSAGYEAGAACWDYLYNLGGDIGTWCSTTAESFKEKGGVSPGDTISIPAEVAQAVQQWTQSNIDFVNDTMTQDEYAFITNGISIALTVVDETGLSSNPSSYNSQAAVLQYGTIIHGATPPSGFDLSVTYNDTVTLIDGLTKTFKWTPKETNFGGIYSSSFSFHGISVSLGGGSFNSASADGLVADLTDYISEYSQSAGGCIVYSPQYNRFYVGACVFKDKKFYSDRRKYVDVSASVPVPDSLSTSISKSPAIDTPVTEERVVVIPQDLPTTDINGKTVPVFDDVQATDVIAGGIIDDPAVPSAVPTTAPGITAGEISGAIADALPVTGAKVGDQVVGEVMAEPDSLGAVFVSKFPFSIPWDIVKAIKLLAAPPVTPRWELDFMQPIAYRVGGFRGDTKLVLDMSEYEIVGIATRWVSTLFFVYALASGTKKLMWTA